MDCAPISTPPHWKQWDKDAKRGHRRKLKKSMLVITERAIKWKASLRDYPDVKTLRQMVVYRASSWPHEQAKSAGHVRYQLGALLIQNDVSWNKTNTGDSRKKTQRGTTWNGFSGWLYLSYIESLAMKAWRNWVILAVNFFKKIQNKYFGFRSFSRVVHVKVSVKVGSYEAWNIIQWNGSVEEQKKFVSKFQKNRFYIWFKFLLHINRVRAGENITPKFKFWIYHKERLCGCDGAVPKYPVHPSLLDSLFANQSIHCSLLCKQPSQTVHENAFPLQKIPIPNSPFATKES